MNNKFEVKEGKKVQDNAYLFMPSMDMRSLS